MHATLLTINNKGILSLGGSAEGRLLASCEANFPFSFPKKKKKEFLLPIQVVMTDGLFPV